LGAPDRGIRWLEHALGDRARAVLPGWAAEFALFVLKQGWACLFGGLLLLALIGTDLVWQPDWPVHRYDALVALALGLQAAFLWLKLETWEEVRVILLFHLTGTVMEIFKVNAGSWSYPEPALLKLWGVPLFSGFMYASVGSYIARVIRNFDMRFEPYPPFWTTVLLATAIYVNFFAHHWLPDIRVLLFVATVTLYARTGVWYRVDRVTRRMPLPVAALLSSVALWVAENVGTATGTWLYTGQVRGEWVSFAKLGSWYLLLYVAFVTVTLVSRRALVPAQTRPRHQSSATTSPNVTSM
jgi:uncharacterized membrane protein YoaT (DUF817 family)